MDIGQQYYCLTKRGAKASKRPLLTSSSSPNIDGLSTTTLPKLTLGNATSGLNSCGKVPICFGQDRKSANEIALLRRKNKRRENPLVEALGLMSSYCGRIRYEVHRSFVMVHYKE